MGDRLVPLQAVGPAAVEERAQAVPVQCPPQPQVAVLPSSSSVLYLLEFQIPFSIMRMDGAFQVVRVLTVDSLKRFR